MLDDCAQPGAVEQTFARFAQADVPVLRGTASELRRLERDIDRISGNDIAQVVLRDPLMTLRVIRFITMHRSRNRTHDITTIAHALMMLGLARFFREFRDLPILQDHLKGNVAALGAALSILSRARAAALFARDWAVVRHDTDPEEIVVASLLHDIGEVLWRCALQCSAGTETDPENAVPPPADLRIGQRHLFSLWGLPGLLMDLMDDSKAERPRVQNVVLGARLARDAAYGWRGPRVEDDFKLAQRLLHTSTAELHERAVRACLVAAREWKLYGVRPIAYYWPMLPEKHA